uniref:Sjoegren syndrome/scleroderma autoantigen 1 n=1 Tax=Plectus sambesii TaxID=2011161 RepID=A0A914WFK4_9BILA
MVHRLFGHRRQVEASNSQADLSATASSQSSSLSSHPTNNWRSNVAAAAAAAAAAENDEDQMGSRMNGLIEPSREQQREIEARRQRNDRISQLMGSYLLRGYKMLDEYCPTCSNILMEDRQGTLYCVACEEIDNVRPNQQSQGTGAVAEISLEDSANLYRLGSGVQLSAASHGSTSVDVGVPANVESTNRRSLADKATVACPFTAPTVSSAACGRDSPIADAVRVVEQKLKWATDKLRTTQNVKESCELVDLMRSCADMIARFSHS